MYGKNFFKIQSDLLLNKDTVSEFLILLLLHFKALFQTLSGFALGRTKVPHFFLSWTPQAYSSSSPF